MRRIPTPTVVKEVPTALAKQVLTLSTGGFSLAAALAWNEFIRSVIDTYVKPYFGGASGLIASLIYAVTVTTIAVIITLQVGKLQQRLESQAEPEMVKPKRRYTKRKAI